MDGKIGIKHIAGDLLTWYEENARVLPWRSKPEPYSVWISEIMLQQTRVEAVKGYFVRFLSAFPSPAELAAAEDDRLLKLWEGLGYYNRARNLKKAAIMIMEEYGGMLPADYEKLLRLPGIGSYTAGAIASIAYGIPVPAVDGNVLRVAKRLEGSFDDITKASVKKEMECVLREIMPKDRAGDYNQALMELGATVCIPNGKPLCCQCPVSGFCKAFKEDTYMEIPVKTPKKSRKKEEKTIVVLEYQNCYALHKRPNAGLLAGLWELPNLEGRISIPKLEKLLEEMGILEYQMELLGEAQHIFSHIEWHMLGYYVRIQKGNSHFQGELKGGQSNGTDGFVWVLKEQMEEAYALPSAFSAYQDKIV